MSLTGCFFENGSGRDTPAHLRRCRVPPVLLDSAHKVSTIGSGGTYTGVTTQNGGPGSSAKILPDRLPPTRKAGPVWPPTTHFWRLQSGVSQSTSDTAATPSTRPRPPSTSG